VIAGEAHPVFLVAHGDQQVAQTAAEDKFADDDTAHQQNHTGEVEDVLGAVGPNVPTQHGLEVGDAIDATGEALLPDDQNGQNRGDGLGDDGEVHATDSALEHGGTDEVGEHRRHHEHRQNG